MKKLSKQQVQSKTSDAAFLFPAWGGGGVQTLTVMSQQRKANICVQKHPRNDGITINMKNILLLVLLNNSAVNNIKISKNIDTEFLKQFQFSCSKV